MGGAAAEEVSRAEAAAVQPACLPARPEAGWLFGRA